MEHITNDVLKKIIRDCGETDEIEEVLSKESEAAVGHGENYCSNIERVKLQVKLKTGKIFKKNLVVKVFLQNLDEAAKFEMRQFWTNERTMYDKILVHFGNLAEKHNLENPIVWPRCYYTNDDIIVFDDLKEEGFTVAPRYTGLKVNDAMQVIRYLGRLHALSFTADKRGMIDPKLIRRPYAWVQVEKCWIVEFIKKGLSVAGDLIKQWGSEWEYAGEKIKDYSNKITKELYALYYEEVKMNVVNHGDAWINNLMVKYDEKNNIESLRFVDFQNSTYNSYAWDLVYFLFTSITGENMWPNYINLLKVYLDEFKNILQKLGEDSKLAPTLEEVESEVNRLQLLAITMACTVTPCVFSTSKEHINLDELVTDEVKLRSLFLNDAWKSTMQINITHWLKNKVL